MRHTRNHDARARVVAYPDISLGINGASGREVHHLWRAVRRRRPPLNDGLEARTVLAGLGREGLDRAAAQVAQLPHPGLVQQNVLQLRAFTQ